MADDEQQPGPSREKRRWTSKKFDEFVTRDLNTVLGLLEDEDLSVICNTGLSVDSFDEEEDPHSEMLRTGGNVDATITQVVRDNIDREEGQSWKQSVQMLIQILSCQMGEERVKILVDQQQRCWHFSAEKNMILLGVLVSTPMNTSELTAAKPCRWKNRQHQKTSYTVNFKTVCRSFQVHVPWYVVFYLNVSLFIISSAVSISMHVFWGCGRVFAIWQSLELRQTTLCTL